MDTHLLLVRHGECIGNIEGRLSGHTDFDLTPNGFAQAELLASRLLPENINIIYSSPLKRAVTTANIIAQICKIDSIILDNDLIEINYGVCDGMSWIDIDKIYPNVRKDWKETYHYPINIPKQESFENCQKRMIRVIETILSNNFGKTICIISHGLVLGSFQCYLHNVPFEHLYKLKLYNNTAFSIINYKNKKYDIIIEAEDNHLYGSITG
ncbi:MAG: histidine phosphatase family protein [Firmicutes bacterium]|nr:histidine phosphatase family protein [Bacillota bacterium]MCL2312254.1 histidine phosphatase family protein [Bacillota bacterium]